MAKKSTELGGNLRELLVGHRGYHQHDRLGNSLQTNKASGKPKTTNGIISNYGKFNQY